MSKFHDVQQGIPEWDALRLGKFTASTFSDLFMTPDKIGYKKAIAKVVYERIIGESYEHYTNFRMESGHQIEILAREHYERQTFTKVSNGGFFEMNEWIGCSPDGVCGKGIVEFKSRDPHIYFEFLESGKLPSANKWQVYGQLWVTGAEWCDYMPFCSDRLKSQIIRVYPDAKVFSELQAKLIVCIKEAQELIKKYTN